MKNKKQFIGGIFGLLTIALAIFAVSSYASADEETQRRGGFGERNPEMHEQMQSLRDSITRTAENTDNGAIVTMTSDNAEAVAFLQSQESRVPRNASVTETRENITNGVKITITSDDADEVARIQENTANPKGEGMRLGKGREGKRGGGCAGGRGMRQGGGFGNQQ